MTAKLPLVSRARFESVRTQYRALTTRLDAGMASIDLLLELAAILAATRLVPVATCRDRAEWERFRSGPAFQAIETEDEAILARRRFDETWRLPGYSFPAERFVNFHVDNLLGRRDGDRFLPNVRESLVCPVTALNNRQRCLMATLIATKVAKRGGPCDIYLMEQVTSVFKWVRARFADHRTVGSEYLGPDLSPGQIVDGLRHEDIHSLSFADDSIDLIVSADVMEHVASPARAFSEVARVLRPGGVALMTFPFDAGLSEFGRSSRDFGRRPQAPSRAHLSRQPDFEGRLACLHRFRLGSARRDPRTGFPRGRPRGLPLNPARQPRDWNPVQPCSLNGITSRRRTPSPASPAPRAISGTRSWRCGRR